MRNVENSAALGTADIKEYAADHVVYTELDNPSTGFTEALGKIGRRYEGADSAGEDCCTWVFDHEHQARSFMEKAAPIAASMSDGFKMNYTTEKYNTDS